MTLLLAILAAVLFAFTDYVGYNSIGQKALIVYRILQTSLQIGLVFLLWQFGSFLAALSFLILWWTFNCDLVYYLFCGWLKWFSTEPANAYEQDINGNVVSWAWWTPFGLLRMWLGKAKKTDPIDGFILEFQALIGLVAVLAIQGFLWGVF